MGEADKKQYVASLSYGKDSIAMIHVIKDVLHLPLDRIITADVWATDTIPAELPPMVEFKDYADEEIKRRWGIEVEHFFATRSFQIPLNVGGGINTHTKMYSTQKSSTSLGNGQNEGCKTSMQSVETQTHQTSTFMDSLANSARGVTANSKLQHSTKQRKISYQDLFYRVRKRGNLVGLITGFPMTRNSLGGAWCNSELKVAAIRNFTEQSKVRWCSTSA